MLTNTAPAASNTIKANITEIGAGNGYAAGGGAAAFVSGNDTAGVYKLILSPVVFTAGGGSIGPFEFAVLYNSTTAGGNRRRHQCASRLSAGLPGGGQLPAQVYRFPPSINPRCHARATRQPDRATSPARLRVRPRCGGRSRSHPWRA